jgi:cell division protein FtsW
MGAKAKKPSSYYALLAVTVTLTLFGIVMVFSASQVTALSEHRDSFYYLKRQLLWAALGFAVLLLLSKLGYRHLQRLSKPFLLVSLGLLVAALVPDISRVAGGASRWLEYGPISFQPSEVAKLAVILFCADILARRKDKLNHFYQLVIPIVPVLILVGLLIMLQPHLGTMVIIIFAVFAVMFVAGARLRHLFLMGVTGVSAVSVLAFTAEYRTQRLISFLNPWKDPMNTGFQIIQSLIALGSGTIFGHGLGMSRQKFFYLPAAHTDFIFAIIGEELGLIGTLAVILAFSILAYLGIRIAFRAPTFFARLLASGITATIIIQALINMGAVTGVLPITGVPLPLISFGGSSLIFTLAGMGILLNISSQERKRADGVVDARDHFRRRNRRASLSSHRPGRRAKIS